MRRIAAAVLAASVLPTLAGADDFAWPGRGTIREELLAVLRKIEVREKQVGAPPP
jgi:hypothetical protein